MQNSSTCLQMEVAVSKPFWMQMKKWIFIANLPSELNALLHLTPTLKHTLTPKGWASDIKISTAEMLQNWFCLPQNLIPINLIGYIFMIFNSRHSLSIKNDLCWKWRKTEQMIISAYFQKKKWKSTTPNK